VLRVCLGPVGREKGAFFVMNYRTVCDRMDEEEDEEGGAPAPKSSMD